MAKAKPTTVFIDTEQFDAHRLSFSNSTFIRLAELVNAGQVRVLLTAVVVGEVKRHIRRELAEARKKLGPKFGGLFQNLVVVPKPPVLDDKFWTDAEAEAMEQFNLCCKKLKAEVLPLDGSLVKTVFDWYFGYDAPFDSHHRKAEFPDAFSIAAVAAWATKFQTPVHVISKDEAFRVASKQEGQTSLLTHAGSLAEFFAIFPDADLAATIRDAFNSYIEDEDNSQFGEEEFQKLHIYVEDEGDFEIESVSIMYTEAKYLHVVEAKNRKAILAGEVYIHFFADIDGIRESPIEKSTFVDAEITVQYDESDPSKIEIMGVKYTSLFGIGISLPRSYK